MTSKKASDPGMLQLTRDIFTLYPKRSVIVLASMFLAGLMEVLGAATLLPLLTIIGDTKNTDSRIMNAMNDVLGVFSLSADIKTLLLIIIALITFKAFFTLIAMRNVGFAMVDMANDMRMKLIRALMRAKWSYFSSLPVGHVANAVGTETNRASKSCMSLLKIISESIVVCIYLVTVFFISWQMTLVAMVTGALIMLLLYKLVMMVRQAGKEKTKHMTDLSGLITDSISSVKVIKAMAHEEHYTKMLEKESLGIRAAKRKWIVGKNSLLAIREPIIIALIAGGIFLATEYTPDALQSLSMPAMVTFAFMFLRIIQKITGLQVLHQMLVIDESAYWSLKDITKRAEMHAEEWGGQKAPDLKHSIRFDNVSFAHHKDDTGVKVFKDVNIEFQTGKLNVLIGKSGAGKTTLVDLIAGFYKPQSGCIYLDDIPLGDVELKAWRQSIGYVPQEPFLFHDTIANNILMGQNNVDEGDVEDALKKAGALSFVKELPEGIHETVGEKGQLFSGGQRQRISIARALVNSPKLLILDEPSSALDKKTEKELFDVIKKLSNDVTVLIISHNMNIRSYADNVFTIENGSITEN